MDPEQLKSALENLVKDGSLAPSGGRTWCNYAVHRIAQFYGVKDFPPDSSGDPPLADEICAILAVSPNFSKCDGEEANGAALGGKFAIAAHAYVGHGHVATVYPSAEMYFSPSWKKEVPFLANVGAKNGVLPCSQVFPVAQGEPHYYIYTGGTPS